MTTLAEPEWDEDTRNLALALDAVPTCPVCGRDPAVCQDPANEFNWQAQDAIRCHAATAARRKQDQLHKNGAEHMDTLLIPLQLVTAAAGIGG